MPDVIHIGPFMLQMNFIIWIVSITTGLFIISYKVKQTTYSGPSVIDTLMSALLFVILIWKFSPILFSPSLLLTNPRSLLFVNGATEGLFLGALVAILYVSWKCWQSDDWAMLIPDLLPFGLSITLILPHLFIKQYGLQTGLPWGISLYDPSLTYHPLHIYRLVVFIPLLFWLMRQPPTRIGTGELFITSLRYGGIGLFVVTLFQPQQPWIFLMSAEQLLYIVVILFAQWLSYRRS